MKTLQPVHLRILARRRSGHLMRAIGEDEGLSVGQVQAREYWARAFMARRIVVKFGLSHHPYGKRIAQRAVSLWLGRQHSSARQTTYSRPTIKASVALAEWDLRASEVYMVQLEHQLEQIKALEMKRLEDAQRAGWPATAVVAL